MSPKERDRNALGCPENARPRDRTGRPLPRDTDQTLLAEDHHQDTVEEALANGWRLWDTQRFFEAHECLEDVWHHAPADERSFWQGVIQVAVLCVHHQRGNVAGVVATAEKVEQNLSPWPDIHHGIDVEDLLVFARGASMAVQQAGSCIEVGYPTLPVMDSGPYFDPDRASTPLTREPPWKAAARARQADSVTSDPTPTSENCEHPR